MYRYVLFTLPVLCSIGSGALAQDDAMRLTRQTAVQLALEHNPEILAAQQIWEASKARIIQARSLPDPELELEFEELPGVTRTGDFGERSFGATQTIESPLKWWRRSQTAVHTAEATRFAEVEMTRLDIRLRPNPLRGQEAGVYDAACSVGSGFSQKSSSTPGSR